MKFAILILEQTAEPESLDSLCRGSHNGVGVTNLGNQWNPAPLRQNFNIKGYCIRTKNYSNILSLIYTQMSTEIYFMLIKFYFQLKMVIFYV